MKQLIKVLAASVIFLAYSSCQKNDIVTPPDEITVSLQETLGEEILADIDLLVDDAIDLNSSQLKSATIGNSAYLTECPAITTNSTTAPKTITIDFGTSCTGKDGKIRSGKIIVTSESFTTFPSVRKKTFEKYVVDGKKIQGTVIKTISKDQVNNIRTAEIKETITIIFPGTEGSATRVATLTRQYQRGVIGTAADNKIASWGTVEFTRVSGVKLTKTIMAATPLIFSVACHHIVSGIVTFKTSKDTGWSINYGAGECDNLATLTNGTKTKEIKIR
jgi:hypothetical protein